MKHRIFVLKARRKKRVELIDRQAILEKMRDCEAVTHSIGFMDMLAILNDAPTIEPEVPHGEWHECWHDERIYSGICSVCGYASIRSVACDALPYCPKCGARMDGKE